MARCALLVLLLIPALWGSVIPIDGGTAEIRQYCQFDGQPCAGSSFSGDRLSGRAEGFYTVSGLNTNVLEASVTTQARASEYSGGAHSGRVGESIDLTFTLTADGPQRPGFMDILAGSDVDWGGTGGAAASAGIPGVFLCQARQVVGCGFSQRIPVTLGAPFSVTLSSSSFASINPAGFGGDGGSSASIRLQFFDPQSGTRVPVRAVVPEPGGMAAVGLLGLGLAVIGRRARALPSAD